jgi:uncharacterized protein DUF4175
VSVDLAHRRLRHLLSRWRRARAGSACLVMATSVALGWGLTVHLPRTAAILATVAVTLAALAWVLRGRAVELGDIARHLDRSLAELEDSAELILAESATLRPLERLQQARIAQRIETAPTFRLPRAPLVRSAAAAAAIAAAALLSFLLPKRDAADGRSRADRAERSALPELLGATISIRPPAYTGLPVRSGAWDLDVESGAIVEWRVRVAGAERVALVRLPADTVRFAKASDGWTATLEATTPSVYQIVAENSVGRTAGPLHRLGVRPDRPPSLTFTEPIGRTTLAPGSARRIRVAADASDDYGIVESFLLVTVASGAGEQVKFRERRLPFDAQSGDSGRSLRLRRTLDLATLGVVPGDEAYLTAVARDGRHPDAQEGRSETVIVAIADTGAAALADFAGLPPLARPAYLRSQRQIILDTERLLGDRARIRPDEFHRRSAAIGDDQRLLRLRYADLLGGETVDAPELGHEHDTEENATLLSPAVKRALTAAVAAMWDAERALGTYEPRAALPHERVALERLKEVQRSGRIYVRRTSTEPPALDLSRRLTGQSKGAGGSSESVAREARVALPAIRAGLAVLERLRNGIRPDPASRASLTAAIDEVAARAAAGSASDLDAVRALRDVTDSLDASVPAGCGGCLAIAVRELWALLPPVEPAPVAPPPAGRVGRTYVDLLSRER